MNDGVGAVGDFDMADDTSLSSRASSRFFDSEPILNLDAFAHSTAGGKSHLFTPISFFPVVVIFNLVDRQIV